MNENFDCSDDIMAEETKKSVIYRGDSVFSIEKVEEYPHPVVIKKSSERHPSRRNLRSLEKECGMTRSLYAVEGVCKPQASETVRGLQRLMDAFQFERIRNLLGELE